MSGYSTLKPCASAALRSCSSVIGAGSTARRCTPVGNKIGSMARSNIQTASVTGNTHSRQFSLWTGRSQQQQQQKGSDHSANNIQEQQQYQQHSQTRRSPLGLGLGSARDQYIQGPPRSISSVASGQMVPPTYLHQPATYNAAAIPFDFEKVMDVSSRLLRERIIMLTGQVDEQTADWVITRLLLLESQNPEKQINLYINSPGGYVTAGLAIYDTMQFIKAPVSTVCLGQACSMGAFLLLSGTPGLRAALPNATIMMHDVGGGYSGQLPDVRVAAQQLMSLSDRMANLAVKHTDLTMDKYKEMIQRDYFMYPEEAIKYGVIDTVLTRPEQAS